jgi:hypothetical protein
MKGRGGKQRKSRIEKERRKEETTRRTDGELELCPVLFSTGIHSRPEALYQEPTHDCRCNATNDFRPVQAH